MEMFILQLLGEFSGCHEPYLDDLDFIKKEMENSLSSNNEEITKSVFHRFNPYGISGVVMSTSAHLAIHTWPEYKYAAIDLMTTNKNIDPQNVMNYLKKAFQCSNLIIKEVNRGP